MVFEDLIEQAHTDVNVWRTAKGLTPYPFRSPYGSSKPAIIISKLLSQGEAMPDEKVIVARKVAYSPEIIDACNLVLECEGVDGVKDFLTEMELSPVKEEDMSQTAQGLNHSVRAALLQEFAKPQFTSVALENLEKRIGLSRARGYYYVAQLRKTKELVEVGMAKSSGTGQMLMQYQVSPKLQKKAAEKEPVTLAVSSKAKSAPAKKSHHKASVVVEPKATAATPIVHPPELGDIHGISEVPEGADKLHDLCSALAHELLDVDLGLRTLSEKELSAMRHLQKMLEEKALAFQPSNA